MCQQQEANVFQCHQLRLARLPAGREAAELELSSCPRIDVKSLEWISRSGVSAPSGCFTFCGNGSVRAQQLDRRVLERNSPPPTQAPEHKTSASSQMSQATISPSGQLFSSGSRI